MKKTVLATLAALTMTLPALAGPHPAYKPVKTDGIPTFKRSNAVGQWIFTMDFPDSKAKSVPNTLSKLSFSKGSPPSEWWGRSYYPCTLKEAIGSIGYASRNYKVATQLWLDGKNVRNEYFEVDQEALGPTWNTTSYEGKDDNDLLADLEPGEHKLIIWRQLNYEVKTVEKGTNIVTWEPAYITLAKGELMIDVTE